MIVISVQKYEIKKYDENLYNKKELIVANKMDLPNAKDNLEKFKKEFYQTKLIELTDVIVYGDSAPRGRIYDRNGLLLVDNEPTKIIYYKKLNIFQ